MALIFGIDCIYIIVYIYLYQLKPMWQLVKTIAEMKLDTEETAKLE